MKKRIHVNQHAIKRNGKNGTNEPCITVKTYKSNDYGHRVGITGGCEVVQRMDKPLSCGARVWIETQGTVCLYDEDVKLTKIIK